ncbi:hypothetical protein ACE2AJ_09835 [Aquihabitans daechungensis]|uniref:NYN domain-containing protein n=1 Tax=Aquihabitans daechungensis TaxID=1052257 RepID=UPI003B9EC6E9
MDDAERIDRQLSDETNSYERAMLYNHCKREFGHGSPRKAIRALERQIELRAQAIDYHQRKLDHLSRNMAKTRQRIEGLVEVALREIVALVIDGNNCSYEAGEFIGLAALHPLTEHLAQRFEVTVVFDSDIRSLLKVRDNDLRTALPDVSVHVVAPRRKADQTILDLADASTTWVVCNDQYGEFRDKVAVKERRLITHEILGGRILVHDLDVNEPLAVQSA